MAKLKILDIYISLLLKILIFLIPIFFVPWTFEFFEFNKQYLLWIFVPVILFLMFVKTLIKGKIKISRTPLDIPILIFLFVIGLSSLFSVDIFSSFFGFYGRFSDAWFGLLSMSVLYFIIINYVSSKKDLSCLKLVKILIYSYSISLFVVLLLIVCFACNIIDGPSRILYLSFNLAGGSLEMFSLYSSIMLTFIFGYVFYFRKLINKFFLLFCLIICFLTIFLLALINYSVAWYGIFLSGFLFLLFYFLNKKLLLYSKNFDFKIIFPIILIIISLIFIVFDNINLDRKIFGIELPKEVILDYKSTSKISINALKNNIFLGSGPGTFFYNFSLYRENEFNNNDLWQFRFDKGSSFLLELIGANGILGLISLLLIISVFIFLFFYFILHIKRTNTRNSFKVRSRLFSILLFINFVLIIFFFIVNMINTILLFLFYFIMAISIISWKESGMPVIKEIEAWDNKVQNNKKFIVLFIFIIFLGWTLLLGYEIKYWIADYYACSGRENDLVIATRLNPKRFNYNIKLAKVYLNRVKTELVQPLNRQNSKSIKMNIDNAINSARFAVNTMPNSVVAQETLGMIYRDLGHIIKGEESLSLMAFNEAIKLEPSNPVLFVELGKAKLNAGMNFEAEKMFLKAMDLKDRYHEAKLGLAKTKMAQKKNLEALILLNDLVMVYDDAEVYYELGRLYYNKGEVKKAIDNFMQVIEINPNHLNALYSMGLSLESLNRKDEAKKYFQKVEIFNSK